MDKPPPLGRPATQPRQLSLPSPMQPVIISYLRERWRLYAGAALMVAVTISLKLLLGANPPYLLCLIGVLMSAWYGGFGPGLFATGLSLAAGLTVFSLPAYTRSTVGEVMFQSVVFVLEGIVVSLLSTFRKRAEEDARRQRELLQVTLASIGDAVVATDARGRVSFINTPASRLTGWTPAEAQGQPLAHVVTLLNEADLSPVTGMAGRIDHALLATRTGQQLPVDATSGFIRGRRSEVLGVVLVFRDISARRRAEEERASQSRELARSNEDLQQFAYVISHDLQEPLRAVTGYGRLLADRYGRQFDEDGREFLSYLADGAERMQRLIRDLLAYSRVMNVEADGDAAVPLEEALTEALLNLQLSIEDSGAAITHDDLPTVSGNAVQFTQLFQNLIGNAIKYRRSECPLTVQIAVERCTGYWRFAVTDNGIGIAEKDRERIFGVFKRLHGREVPGTGIGLAICRKIVERHGGRIWAESAAGQGSTFFFTLPAEPVGPAVA